MVVVDNKCDCTMFEPITMDPVEIIYILHMGMVERMDEWEEVLFSVYWCLLKNSLIHYCHHVAKSFIVSKLLMHRSVDDPCTPTALVGQ